MAHVDDVLYSCLLDDDEVVLRLVGAPARDVQGSPPPYGLPSRRLASDVLVRGSRAGWCITRSCACACVPVCMCARACVCVCARVRVRLCEACVRRVSSSCACLRPLRSPPPRLPATPPPRPPHRPPATPRPTTQHVQPFARALISMPSLSMFFTAAISPKRT